MKNNHCFKTLITASLIFGLMGCGGDDSGLLDEPAPPTPPPTTESLRAFPKAVMLTEGDFQTITLTDAVEAIDIDSWALTDVQDANSLGEISQQTATSFDYLAKTSGMTSLPYEVQGGGKTSASQILVAINAKDTGEPDVNMPPTAQNIALETSNTQELTVDLNQYIFDADGDALSIEHFITTSERFVFDADSHSVTFKPAGFVGVEQAVYSVEDGNGGYAFAYIVVTSKNSNPETPNTAPVAKDYNKDIDSKQTPEWDIELTELNLISDADNDELSLVRVFDGNDRAVINGKTGIRYTPGDFIGIDQFTYIITDGEAYASGIFTLTISDSTPTNQAPTAGRIVASIEEGSTSPITISVAPYVSDPDGDALQIISLYDAQGLASVSTSNPLEIEYLPDGATVQDKFFYIVTDGKGGYAQSSVTVTITNPNPNAPRAEIAGVTTLHDEPVSVNLDDYISDTETANSGLSVANLQGATLPAIAKLNGKTVTYTPNGFLGTETLTYTVSDGELSAQGIIIIGVNPDADHTVTANDFAVSVAAGSEATRIDWRAHVSTDATDEDGKILLLTAIKGAELGRAEISGSTLNYTPSPGKFGVDKLTYTVEDGHTPAQFANGQITVTIEQPMEPEITALSIDGNPNIGDTLTANVTCTTCVPAKYQYKWVINGLVAGTASTYTYQASDADFNIRLEVTGEDAYQQQTSEYVVYGMSKIKEVSSSHYAFAAVKSDDSVVTWGAESYSGQSSSLVFSADAKNIYSTRSAFAILKSDGSVFAWGNPEEGGEAPASVTDRNSDVKAIYSNIWTFVAVKGDGSVVAWGRNNNAPTSVTDANSGVKTVYSTDNGFAALKEDGSVVSWQNTGYTPPPSSVTDANSGVKAIYSTNSSFAALKADGSVVVWGHPYSASTFAAPASVTDENSGVITIYSNIYSFAALKSDGTVITWGQIERNPPPLSGNPDEQTVYSANTAFAALRRDGTVVVWGVGDAAMAPSSVTGENSDVRSITPTYEGFAALKGDGSVVAWGFSAPDAPSSVTAAGSNVTKIYASSNAYAALKQDGSVVSWGAQEGGDSTGVDFSGGVETIYSNKHAFTAVKKDGSVVSWGRANNGGDSSAVKNELAPSFSKVKSSIM